MGEVDVDAPTTLSTTLNDVSSRRSHVRFKVPESQSSAPLPCPPPRRPSQAPSEGSSLGSSDSLLSEQLLLLLPDKICLVTFDRISGDQML